MLTQKTCALLSLCCLVAFVLPLPIARAQDNAADQSPQVAQAVPAGIESPRDAMFSFLEATDAHDFAAAARTMELPPGTEIGAQSIASRLLGVLNRIGLVEPSQLPDAQQSQRSNITFFRFFPQENIVDHQVALSNGIEGEILFAQGADGGWRFARSTIDSIDALYASAESLARKAGIDEAQLDSTIRIQRLIPRQLRGQSLGLFHWQWLGLLLLLFIAVVLDFSVQLALRGFTTRRLRKRGADADAETIKRTVRPYGLLAAALFMIASLWVLALPTGALRIVIPAIRLVLSVAGVWAAFRTVDLISLVATERAKRSVSRFDDLLVPLIRKTLKIFIFAIGLIYIAGALNIEIVPLLTGLGIGGLAVAFAAKDTIENFFGSIAVIMDNPFQVGDWVVIDDVEGIVEELGFRSTRIRTFYNSQVTIANAGLVRATVDNYGRRKYRRFRTMLNITYDTPPDTIEAFCEGVRELIRVHPYTRKDYYCVYFNAMGAHSLDILVYTFFEAPDWQTELRERQRFLLDVLRLAKQLNVEFAFPTQTLWVNPEADSAAPPSPPTNNATDAAQQTGRDAVHTLVESQPWRQQKPGPETILFAAHDAKRSKTESTRGGGVDGGDG